MKITDIFFGSIPHFHETIYGITCDIINSNVINVIKYSLVLMALRNRVFDTYVFRAFYEYS